MAESFTSGIDFWSLALDTDGASSGATFQAIYVPMTSARFIVIEGVYSDPLACSRVEGRGSGELWQQIS